MTLTIRPERPTDVAAIGAVVRAAFAQAEHASGTEHLIVDALRRAGALSISLVAEGDGLLVGHVAISPVTVGDGSIAGWFGLGPIAVLPERQRSGVGAALMGAALDALRARGARGCVVLGDPAYYGRFGFRAAAPLELPGVPARYFQALPLAGETPPGVVRYHAAFEAS